MKRKFTTLQNINVTMHLLNGNKYIDDVRITEHDVMATNGVIHVINNVLKPHSGKCV